MTRSRPIKFLASAAVIPLVALTVAACGGGGSAATAAAPPAKSTTTTTTTTTTAKTVTVRVAKSSLGSILVDSTGRTLYLFKADMGTKSACMGACAVAWPPLLATGKPIAGKGLTASKLGTTTRSGGTRQVTYNGHPLYLFIKDTKPGRRHRPGPHGVWRRLVRGFSRRQPDLKPTDRAQQHLIVVSVRPHPPRLPPRRTGCEAPSRLQSPHRRRRRRLPSPLRQPATGSPKTTAVTTTRTTMAGRATETGASERCDGRA